VSAALLRINAATDRIPPSALITDHILPTLVVRDTDITADLIRPDESAGRSPSDMKAVRTLAQRTRLTTNSGMPCHPGYDLCD
jgi:hypothetical protein